MSNIQFGKVAKNYGKVKICWFFLTLILLIIHRAELAKLSIKSQTGDWCIRVKGRETVSIGKCFWSLDESSRNLQQAEQTFDIHPADVDEERSDYERPKPFTSFLIRLSSQLKRPASSATNCLSSISSLLSVEKCNLRKSRFRLSAKYLPQPSSNSCSSTGNYNGRGISYSILSSDRLCLQLETRNGRKEPRSPHSLTFAICEARDDKKSQESQFNHQLWQLCDQKGNCSLSPSDFNWSSMIKTEWPTGESKLDCTEEKETTTISLTTSRSTTTSTLTSTTSISTTTTTSERLTITESTTEINLEPERETTYESQPIHVPTEKSSTNESIIILPVENGSGQGNIQLSWHFLCLLFLLLQLTDMYRESL